MNNQCKDMHNNQLLDLTILEFKYNILYEHIRLIWFKTFLRKNN